MLVQVMSFVDLVAPENQLLVQDVQASCKVDRLLGELKWEQVW